MPTLYVEDKPNLRSDLRTNFPEFQTFILVTPTVVMIPDGYSQPLYDWLTTNCVIVSNPISPASMTLDLGSVMAGEDDSEQRYSPAHKQWFRWRPDAGVAGEWWSEQKEISWGGSGNIGNGAPFRILSYLATASDRGFPILSRTRMVSVAGKSRTTETGRVDVRKNGASVFHFDLNNQEATSLTFDITDSRYLIEMDGGAPLSPDTEQNYLQFYWINSSTGSFRDPQFRMQAVNVLIPGD